MARVDSAVDVCNLALDRLGEENITSLTQTTGSVEAQQCAKLYDHARRFVLEQFEWSFAIRRTELAQVVFSNDAIEYEYEYGYQVPTECIRLMKIFPLNTPYEVEEGNVLYTNATKVYAQYIFDQEDVTKWNESFIKTVSAYMAALLTIPLQGKEARYQTFLGEYILALTNAKGHNADAKREPPSTSDSWVDL